jgi:hypothetical protein
MLYNTKNPYEKQQLKDRLKKLLDKEARIELLEKNGTKNPSQNRYLHLLLGWFALEYGDSIQYVKQELFKKQINPALFKTEYINKKPGDIREDWRSWADSNKEDTASSITRFKDWASKEAGIDLPDPDEREFIYAIEERLAKYNSKKYL